MRRAEFDSAYGAVLEDILGWGLELREEDGPGTLEAWDSVYIQSMDGSNRRMRTSHLIYDRDQNQIRSDSEYLPSQKVRGSTSGGVEWSVPADSAAWCAACPALV